MPALKVSVSWAEFVMPMAFLASDDAAYVTGVILPVDGGITAGWNRSDLPSPDAQFMDSSV